MLSDLKSKAERALHLAEKAIPAIKNIVFDQECLRIEVLEEQDVYVGEWISQSRTLLPELAQGYLELEAKLASARSIIEWYANKNILEEVAVGEYDFIKPKVAREWLERNPK